MSMTQEQIDEIKAQRKARKKVDSAWEVIMQSVIDNIPSGEGNAIGRPEIMRKSRIKEISNDTKNYLAYVLFKLIEQRPEVGQSMKYGKPTYYIKDSVLNMTNEDIIKKFNEFHDDETEPLCFEDFDFDGWRKYMFERGNWDPVEAIEVSYDNHAECNEDAEFDEDVYWRINWEGEAPCDEGDEGPF